MVFEPSGAYLGIPPELLADSPFSTYLVPGIVLFTVNGLGSLVGAAASFAQYRYAGETAMALGVFLVAWIILQVYWRNFSLAPCVVSWPRIIGVRTGLAAAKCIAKKNRLWLVEKI